MEGAILKLIPDGAINHSGKVERNLLRTDRDPVPLCKSPIYLVVDQWVDRGRGGFIPRRNA